MAIDVPKELAEAEGRLPVIVDREMPLDMTIRTIALTIAQRHVGDTVIREGNLYTQLKMDNKPIKPVSVDDVMNAALVFERYLWGEWSKGIAENALESTMTDVAAYVEKQFEAGKKERVTGAPEQGGREPDMP
jgi:hypothetical protein